GGSTAVEVALKMAFQHWKQRGKSEKRKFVALSEGYHGDTLGSVSVGGVDLFHEIFRPLLFDCLRVPAPYAYRWPTGPKHCLESAALAAESMIHGRRDEIAAVILEPLVMGAAGMITHPPGYLKRIARACRENGVLLICDEVATGFGRTGTLFACEQEEVVPDFLCLAKGLTGGYLPLAATLTTGAAARRRDPAARPDDRHRTGARPQDEGGVSLCRAGGAQGRARRAPAGADAAALGQRGGADTAALDQAGRGGFPGGRCSRVDRRGDRVKGFFVAGTDTGVGKTEIARAICASLARKGLRPLALKPVETGCEPDRPEDALALREECGSAQSL